MAAPTIYRPDSLSAGFDGTIDEFMWAQYGLISANDEIVGTVDDLRVEAIAGRRSITVRPGYAFRQGVYANVREATVIDLPTPATGGQWHAIFLATDWSENETHIERHDSWGTDENIPTWHPLLSSVPAALDGIPGIFGLQLLAYVWVNAKNLDVTVWDMRRMAPQPIPIAPAELLIANGSRYSTALVVPEKTFQTVKTVKFWTEEPTRIYVTGYMRWVSKEICAGYTLVTLNGIQRTPGYRQHNDGVGKNIPQSVTVTGMGWTVAGENTLELVCTAEANNRYVSDIELQGYVL